MPNSEDLKKARERESEYMQMVDAAQGNDEAPAEVVEVIGVIPGFNQGFTIEPESICAEADRIVSNDRNDFYGHPFDNYRRIAGAVEALDIDATTPEGSILLMIVTKIAREVHRPKRDNRVDICGYAKALDLLHAERERRGL